MSSDPVPSAQNPATDERPEGEKSVRAGGEMSFLDHLEDLRGTLLKSLLAFGVAAALVAVFLAQFAEVLQWPYTFAVADREIEMSGLINTSILGIFSVIFYLMIGGGFALALPFILYFTGQFLAPGLTERELRLLRPACLGAFLLFVLGALFSFSILVPAALRASILFNDMLGFAPLWTAASYYGFMTWMVLGVGMAFEFPLVLMILIHLQILSTAQLIAFRRYSLIIFLCVGAVLTPTTDPVTFILLALPMSVLYEVAIIGGRKIERRADGALKE